LTVFGEFEPKNVVGYRVSPQKGTSLRHNACFEPSCAPLRPIGTNFGLRVHLVDLINCAKFYRNRLRRLDSVRGRILTIPIGLRCRR